MIQRLTITGRLPGLNDMLLSRGRGHYAWNAKKKRLEEEIMWEIKRDRIRPVARARFSFHFFERDRRRDPDNVDAVAKKVIFDAMVKAGVLQNDGWDQIAGIRLEYAVDKDNPRIEVYIEEV